MSKGLFTLPPWVTTEGVFAFAGGVWLVLIGFTPIPESVPLGFPIPGFESINITPGLLIGVALVPVILKAIGNNTTPFVGARKEESKDA